jgi:hypothetical protein
MGETPAAVAPIQPEPVALANLFDLFVRPSAFFAGTIALGRTPAVLLVSWIVGIANTLDRVDMVLLRDSARQPNGFAAALTAMPALSFWGLIAALGALMGLLIYRIGGWWYGTRILLCGVQDADATLARHVHIYATFVADAPLVLVASIQTVRYGTYSPLHANDLLVEIQVLILAVFWSVVVSWKGVRAAFPTIHRRKAAIWFLVLPCAFFVVVTGAVAALVALFAGAPQG